MPGLGRTINLVYNCTYDNIKSETRGFVTVFLQLNNYEKNNYRKCLINYGKERYLYAFKLLGIGRHFFFFVTISLKFVTELFDGS